MHGALLTPACAPTHAEHTGAAQQSPSVTPLPSINDVLWRPVRHQVRALAAARRRASAKGGVGFAAHPSYMPPTSTRMPWPSRCSLTVPVTTAPGSNAFRSACGARARRAPSAGHAASVPGVGQCKIIICRSVEGHASVASARRAGALGRGQARVRAPPAPRRMSA